MGEYKTPKKVKFRRHQRGRRCGTAKRGTELAFGEFALKALEPQLFLDFTFISPA